MKLHTWPISVVQDLCELDRRRNLAEAGRCRHHIGARTAPCAADTRGRPLCRRRLPPMQRCLYHALVINKGLLGLPKPTEYCTQKRIAGNSYSKWHITPLMCRSEERTSFHMIRARL